MDWAFLSVSAIDHSGSYAIGAMGVLTAMFTQSTASGSTRLVVLGFMFEFMRRAFQWLYARVLIRKSIHCCSGRCA
jgi:hypothetical protein